MSRILWAIAIVAGVLAFSVAIPMAFAEITVKQDNLTAEEQKVLDDIAAARADGTYIQPPEADFTATVQKYSEDVIIQSPFPVSEVYCGEHIFKYGIPEMTCTVVGTTPEGMALWDEVEGQWIPDTVIEQEANAQAQEIAARELSLEERQLQAVQNKIDQLREKRKLSAADQAMLNSFSDLSICMRGLEDTEAFQERTQFVIPVESLQLVNGQWVIDFPETDSNQSLNYRDNSLLSKMYKAAQECEAQIKMMGYPSPGHYRNKVMTADDFQPYHADQATLDKGIEAFGTDFTDRKDGDLITEAAKSHFAMCLSDNLNEKFKKQIGCPSPYIGFNEPGEPSGFTLEIASPNINHEKWAITCGLIPDNGHIVNDLYWDYMKDLEQRFNCSHWDRVNGIMLFHDKKWNQPMIDEQIAKYQESKQQ